MKLFVKSGVIATAMLGASTVWAQSSVTLFGLIDGGITYASNVGGASRTSFGDGIFAPNLWGLMGQEDLGGGLKAVFRLVNQFNLGTGSMLVANTLFSREAWVGISSAQYGKLTFGSQYDFMVDSLNTAQNTPFVGSGGLYVFPAGPFAALGLVKGTYAGFPGSAGIVPGVAAPPTAGLQDFNWDRTAGGNAVPNSVKYVTPEIGGFKAGAMYSFGGEAGAFGAGSALSVGANYDHGPFGIGAAYLSMKPTVYNSMPVRWWGVGAHYQFGPITWVGNATGVHNSINGASVYQGSIGATYPITPSFILGGAYTYMKGNAYLSNNHANQFALALSHPLSKRTVIYAQAAYQMTNANAPETPSGGATFTGIGQSSTDSQFIARVGLFHSF
ncbi:porin [Paraburkholderia fungorum]|uniref:porin n=1 Tax=Paraburkholderia fungorum TaxID=134537 RepID=UPI0003FDC56F|nr:porin [Paraburkholderia fungorum]